MSTPSSLSLLVAWLCAGVPALYLAAAALVAVGPRERAARLWAVSGGLALSATLAAAVVLVASPAGSPLSDPLGTLIGSTLEGGRVWSLRTDVLTGVVLLLVTFIGWVVVRFSSRYLDGDSRQLPYLRRLLLTLAAVSALVSSNNLGVIAALWLGASLSLHGLLTHFAERIPAQIAAHKKFLLSRFADACLLAAVAMTAASAHSLELDRVFDAARRAPELSPALAMSSVLIAVGVVLRCAQLPFHGWLIQVMEAPTPVSALLHAGVVNIGGFLLIRLAPLMHEAHGARALLLVAGTVTATCASLVMLTRISVKVMLAWSTCAQMGLMLVECALGAYDMALLHLVAHSLYKAHAFLSAGGTVATQRVAAMSPAKAPRGVGLLLASGAASLAFLALGLSLSGVDVLGAPRHWFPVTLLALALPSFLLQLPRRPGVGAVATVGAAAFGVALCYGVGHFAFQRLLPGVDALTAVGAAPAGAAVLSLLVLFVVHTWVRQRPQSALARWLYPRAFAGFYLDERFTRLTFRLWPARYPTLHEPSLLLTRTYESSPQ